MARLDGKVVLITGGSLGIGRAAAMMCAREGGRVVVTDIREDEGNELVQRIKGVGGEAAFMRHDAGSEDDWLRVTNETVAKFGGLDAVVNNAGVAIGGNAEDTTLADWRKLMAVNLDGVFLGTRHGILAMKDRGGGSIINMSSIEGIIGDPNLAAYNASKGGVRLLTKSAALHCARSGYGIRVNTIHPGYIWTPMVENYLASQGDVEKGREALSALHPVGHLGEPDDIAYGIVYLASDESRFMTGAELVIDGGYTAQ